MLAHYKRDELVDALTIAGDLHTACPEHGPIAWCFTRLRRELATEGTPTRGGVVHLDDK